MNNSYQPDEIYMNIMTHIMPYLYNICPSHGILHMQTVFNHSIKAIAACNIELSDQEKRAIVIAAFLHDIDDRKFFNTTNYDNARQIIREAGASDIEELIIKMIKYVSSSNNRNEIAEECKNNPWLLIPRYCDRIEAIGTIGLIRTFVYTKTINRRLFDDDTKKYTKEELISDKLSERYDKYSGNSTTMIDHIYDKLLHICKCNTGNDYIDDIIKERNNIMIDFCVKFGKNEFLNENEIETYVINLM